MSGSGEQVVTGECGSDYARFNTVRSIAAAAERFGGRPSAFGRIPPTGGVGVRERFLLEELPCCGFFRSTEGS